MEPPTPRQNRFGWQATNLFWPGEQDANGTVFSCVYGPLVAYAEKHQKLVALGGCTPAGCQGCDGLHRRRRLELAGGSSSVQAEKAAKCPIANSSSETRPRHGCMKSSGDGGKSWSKIRAVIPYPRYQGGMLVYERASGDLLQQHATPHTAGGGVVQIRSSDAGLTWSDPLSVSAMLGRAFSTTPGHPSWEKEQLAVGPGQAIQLSATNKFHSNRLLFAGTKDGYGYDCIWYSDDGGRSYSLSKDVATGRPLKLWQQSEIALAETPDGGVITSSRNQDYHRAFSPGSQCYVDEDCYTGRCNLTAKPLPLCVEPSTYKKFGCNCRGVARSTDGVHVLLVYHATKPSCTRACHNGTSANIVILFLLLLVYVVQVAQLSRSRHPIPSLLGLSARPPWSLWSWSWDRKAASLLYNILGIVISVLSGRSSTPIQATVPTTAT